jgi:hypothetical protein
VPSGQDAKPKSQACLDLVRKPVAQPQPKRAEKPHSNPARKTLDGPATRPKTPLAVENGVGKPAAAARCAPNVGTGKRAWRTPIPRFVPVWPQGRTGTYCFAPTTLATTLCANPWCWLRVLSQFWRCGLLVAQAVERTRRAHVVGAHKTFTHPNHTVGHRKP